MNWTVQRTNLDSLSYWLPNTVHFINHVRIIFAFLSTNTEDWISSQQKDHTHVREVLHHTGKKVVTEVCYYVHTISLPRTIRNMLKRMLLNSTRLLPLSIPFSLLRTWSQINDQRNDELSETWIKLIRKYCRSKMLIHQ